MLEGDINETELARRLELTKQAISWRVTRALKKGWLVNHEPRSGKPYRLRRGRLLPSETPALPTANEVEYAFEGVPACAPNMCFFRFASVVAAACPQGFTAAEWASRVECEVGRVRMRLDSLVDAQLLMHDEGADRYSLPDWVREHVKTFHETDAEA